MRATQFEFVNWDDNTYVTDNAQVLGGLTARSVVWAFTTTHAPYWHPVNWLSHILDVELFGLDAGGHHLTSVAIHLANTVLLFVLLLLLDVWPLRRLGGDPDDRVGWGRHHRRHHGGGVSPASASAVPLRRLDVVPRDASAGDRTRAGRSAGDGGPVHVRPARRHLHRHRLGRSRPCRSLVSRAAATRAAALAAVVLCASLARAQTGYWASSLVLWQRAVDVAPENYRAFENLGAAQRDRGLLEPALQSYRESARLAPGNPAVYNSIGLVLTSLGRLPGAAEQFTTATRLQPDYLEARNNLGNAFAALGRLPDAVACYREVLRGSPESADTRTNLGNALAATERLDEAIAEYRQAIAANPISRKRGSAWPDRC